MLEFKTEKSGKIVMQMTVELCYGGDIKRFIKRLYVDRFLSNLFDLE